MRIAHIVHGLGGFAQKQQLIARGARDVDLTRAVRSGEVIRARQGWYTTLPPQDPTVRAVRVGGRLTGLSAVDQAGGWVIRSRHLHVSVPQEWRPSPVPEQSPPASSRGYIHGSPLG